MHGQLLLLVQTAGQPDRCYDCAKRRARVGVWVFAPMTWQECFVMVWLQGGGVCPCSVLVHSYTLDLMTQRNVNQRFNKQNPVRTWWTQMCMKWLLDPPHRIHFLGLTGGNTGSNGERDITWPAISNTSRSAEPELGRMRPIFSTGLLLLYDCVCLRCCVERENVPLSKIISPAGCLESLDSPPPPPPPSSFQPSLNVHLLTWFLLPWGAQHQQYTPLDSQRSCPKTGQPVQTRDGSIRLYDCWEAIQSNFNWQVGRILETFLLSPKYTRAKKKKKKSSDGQSCGAALRKHG